MTTLQRLRRARVALLAGHVVHAVLIAACAVLVLAMLMLLVDVVMGLPLAWRERLRPGLGLFIAAGVVSLFAMYWVHVRGGKGSLEGTALWFEQRLPSLHYALVTVVGLATPDPALEHLAAAAPLESEVRQAWLQALLKPALAVAVLAAVFLALPDHVAARVLAPRAGDSLNRPSVAARAVDDPLASIVVDVQPPRYAGAASVSHDNPATVSALVGSGVRVHGLGAPDRVTGALGGAVGDAGARVEVGPGRDANAWATQVVMPAAPVLLRLQSAGRERVLLLDPVIDSAPSVRLDLPARDTVLREGRGIIALAAELADDIGLAEAQFEFIVSVGSGESFSFRTGTFGARTYGAAQRGARLTASISLDTLRLGPGDLVHLRAVATDRNDITGPGRGVSETRAIRIARADEADSVSVEPAPPPALDTAALSQRMILMQTEDLQRRVPRLTREQVVAEARRIARDQTRLRKRVGEVIFMRLGEDSGGEHSHFAGDGHEHGEEKPLNPDDILAAAERAANANPITAYESEGDETPIVAINRPLLDAYNHMWNASSALETGDPAEAIPWMRRAIEALQRARAAERLYLRGQPPRVVIDLARVRGTGKDESKPETRFARPPVDPQRAARLARFDAILPLVAAHPAAAADSLLLVRVTVPNDERATAQALDAAANALRRESTRGGNVTDALANARRALAGEPPRRTPLTPWGM